LNPKPIAFTERSLDELSEGTMRHAIQQGKANTAMMSFASILTEQEIEAVIHFVRQAFMSKKMKNTKYHTVENGWPNHKQYQSAYPFVFGEIRFDENVDNLTQSQRHGRQLYLSACISCHDRARVKNEGAIWQSFPLSWPRNTYSHKEENQYDGVSQASPYHIHDIKIVYKPTTEIEQQGQRIFQANCAFCHAADGTGKHWIGQFIEPPAKDFTQQSIQKIFNKQTLKDRIENGVVGSAMPAWRYVLSDGEIDSLVNFMWQRFK